MKFKIDKDMWKIKLVSKDYLLDLYRKSVNEDAYYAFGVCIFPQHVILINKDMCREQQIKTLKHELTHCWIFYSGLYNANYNEEMVCDIVSNIHNFIEDIISKFINNKEE